MIRRDEVLKDISKERDRQEELLKAGRFKNTCASPDMDDAEACAVLGEEFGEVCAALLEKNRSVFDRSGTNLYKELTHVATVAVAWMEKLRIEADTLTK